MAVPAYPVAGSMPTIQDCMRRSLLHAVFQPIGSLRDGSLLGHEALIRGPAGSPIESALTLFEIAEAEGRASDLELFAAQLSLRTFASAGTSGKLFLNFSPAGLRRLVDAVPRVIATLNELTIESSRIVVELTERSEVDSLDALNADLTALRGLGFELALDDYGAGNATLGLWAALSPNYIKVDRSLVHGVASSPFQLEALRGTQRLAAVAQSAVIVEGVEELADLVVCRDLGISFAQGYVLGRPHASAATALPKHVAAAICSESIAVFPVPENAGTPIFSSARFVVYAPTVSLKTTNNDVFEAFSHHPTVHALAVVEDNVPVGLISRRSFVDRYALPFQRELIGKKTCVEFVNTRPVTLEKTAPMQEVLDLLTGEDQQYLIDGLIIVEGGLYVGLATGEALVRAVTEVRIEAARYANPLTFLPGNMPIDLHIQRLVSNKVEFHACYCDLNSFKPFNDQYGYWQGDEMLKLAAAILTDVCDPRADFLGHVGGDDFLIFFQSTDWMARIRTAIQRFNEGAIRLYNAADIKAGGIVSEDRHGDERFYGFVTMAVGVVAVRPGATVDPDRIATMAAAAKREAKKTPDGLYVSTMEAFDASVPSLAGGAA